MENFNEKQNVTIRFPKRLLERIDEFKKAKGFGTRTQAIFYLIQAQLDDESKKQAAHVAAFYMPSFSAIAAITFTVTLLPACLYS